MEREQLIRTARGDRPAALLLKNARLVNVFTAEVYETDIAIRRSRIIGIGSDYHAEGDRSEGQVC
jgi:adenine deaminase